jgi:hypothetical protein
MGQHEEILKQDLVPYNDGLPSGARLVPIDSNEREPLTTLCLRMREKLETHHVICPQARSRELCQALRDQDPTVQAVLEDGFYKLLVIEVSKGLDSKGGFDHDGRFLPYLRQVLYTSFGVEPTDDFHPEQIAQAAKDEPRSLFCFLDAQYIQGPEIQRLRIFTQTHHRVLLCAIPPATGPPVRSSPIQDEDDTAEFSVTPDDRPLRNASTESAAWTPILQRANGEAAGQIIELKPYRIVIGRSPKLCHVVIDGEGVNRKHAVIYRKGDEFYLADLNSFNGTKVNATRVIPDIDHRLVPGDRINICGIEFLYYRRFKEDLVFEVASDFELEVDLDDELEADSDDELEADSDLVFEMESDFELGADSDV